MEELEKMIWEKLKEVIDPELNINVVDLGLIYEVKMEGKKAHIKMSFTSPACPLVMPIAKSVEQKALEVEGVEDVLVEVVWDPPWTPERMSEDAKKMLGKR